VWDYIRAHKVPYNPLHDRGFASIGCEPCTRAVEPGVDERSGRWWWEREGTKECGLHVKEENRGQSAISPSRAGLAFQNDLRFFGAEIHGAKKPETMEGQNCTDGQSNARSAP